MSGALFIFLIGALAAVALGVADFLGARASKDIGPITAAFVVQAAGTLAYCMWFVAAGADIPPMALDAWLYALAGALLMGAGMCTLYLAFERGPVSLASPLSAAYPLVTAAVGVLFFHAALGVAEGAAVAVIVVGIMAASGLLGLGKSERGIGVGPQLALLTTLMWGIGYPLLGQAITAAGWEAVTLIQLIAMVPTLGVTLAVRRRREHVTRSAMLRAFRSAPIIAAGVLQMLAVLAINVGYGLDQASGTMVVATSAAYPVVTMVLALWRFDERTERVALAGAALTVVGVLALHVV